MATTKSTSQQALSLIAEESSTFSCPPYFSYSSCARGPTKHRRRCSIVYGYKFSSAVFGYVADYACTGAPYRTLRTYNIVSKNEKCFPFVLETPRPCILVFGLLVRIFFSLSLTYQVSSHEVSHKGVSCFPCVPPLRQGPWVSRGPWGRNERHASSNTKAKPPNNYQVPGTWYHEHVYRRGPTTQRRLQQVRVST